jgi:hydroxymethylpyrimidine pyrophosphatase-like HAD family hydrolase
MACGLLGIETDHVAAFGDSENDLEMISNCGIGIAPSNGMEVVKKVADHVTENPNGMGVIEGLKYLGLIDRVF